jgi:hypothetical protein
MRFVHAAVLLALSVSPALAQMGPYFVIPGRPDVPIFENGVDVSWSVVEGEYGLNRPNIVNPVIVYRMSPVVVPYPGRAALGPPYYPRDGMMPGYGPLEMRPPPFSSAAAAGTKLQPLLADGIGADAGGPEHHRTGHYALRLPGRTGSTWSDGAGWNGADGAPPLVRNSR